MKILIADGDRQFFDAVARYLKREGHICEQARDVAEAGKKIVNHEYDCLLVALGLSRGGGIKLIGRLKEQQAQAGIIVIAAGDVSEDRVRALNEGADDVVLKSIALPELYARIRAVMRRRMGHPGKVMDFGKLKIRLEERMVEAGGTALQLTRKEFDILVFLARNKNRVVTKDSIAELLWSDNQEDQDSYDFLYAHMKNLRKKLAGSGCGEYLQTVYGVGYKFSAG
jgi:DNA-binding response OmpR family regulator